MPNNNSTLVYLDCAYEPTTDSDLDYWRGYAGAFLALDRELTPDQIRQLLGGRRSPTVRTPGGRTVVNADFVLLCTKCTGMPAWFNGAEPYGRYLPAVVIVGNGVMALVNEPTTCPHCAYLRATELLAQGDGVNTDVHRPCVYYVGDNCRINERVEFDVEQENGRITFTTNTTKMDYTERGCANCGFPGHTRTACPRERHYAKVGVEIEGRFFNVDELISEVEDEGLDITHDGSIYHSTTLGCEPREIRTKPDLLAGCLRQVAKFYPDEADKSCGLHVHVSFNDTASVSTLTCPEFLTYFVDRWTLWGARMGLPLGSQFFKRLSGDNDFCLKNDPHELARPFSGDRYRQLNFTSWEKHNTVECRLLPMFREARLALSAITELITIYEDWLNGACDAYLPTAVAGDRVDDVEPTQWADAGVIDAELFEAKAEMTAGLEIAELPPVAEGHRRVVMTANQASALRILAA